MYSILSCSGFNTLSSTCDSCWELLALGCGLFAADCGTLNWCIQIFTLLSLSWMMYSHPSPFMLGSALWYAFDQWNEWTQHTLHPNMYTATFTLWLSSSLAPSLCNEKRSILDQGCSFSLNLRKSRTHFLELTCSLQLYQLFSTFYNISKKINSCSWNL